MIRSTELPLLPGYSFNYNVGQTRFHKSHHFDLIGGEIPYLSEKNVSGIGGVPLAEQDRFPSVYSRGEVADLPAWVVYDKQSLTFDAYYLENIYEGGLYQNYVVHKCKICYFLEDGTIQVFEKPVTNSGLPQGCIIRRQKIRIPSRDNSGVFYDMLDLNIGREIDFFGKVFKLTDCDLFTRRFLNRLGVAVPDPIQAPDDPYLKLRNMEGKKQRAKKQAMKKMLEEDERILTFHAYWDDNASEQGTIHKLKVLYYLADGTIEVKDVTDPERSYTLIRRCKFPKDMELGISGPGADENVTLLNVLGPSVEKSRSVVDPLAIGVPDKEYYTDCDLTIGSVLASYGRRFVIVDMDPFTKEYYHVRYGLEDILPLEVPKTKEELAMEKGEKVRPPTPPYNGFGSFEDSLHNVRHLIPESRVLHSGRRDPAREPFGYDSKILRFGAYLLENEKIVEGRRFIISYYLIDGTISVYEIPFANSGRDGGVILGRRKMYYPGQNLYSSKPLQEVQLQDFYLGNTVILEQFHFHIVDIDEYTMHFMEKNPSEFPKSNVRTIISKLRDAVRFKYKEWAAPLIREVGPVQYQEYRASMKVALGDQISEHEILALARHFNHSPAIQKYNKESIRAMIHDDLRRFLYEDFERLEESFGHFDPRRSGVVPSKEAYSTLRGARVPITPELIRLVVDMFSEKSSEGKNTITKYRELIDFLNYKKYQVPSVNKIDFKGAFGMTSLMTSPDQTKILNVDVKGIIDELQLEEELKKESL